MNTPHSVGKYFSRSLYIHNTPRLYFSQRQKKVLQRPGGCTRSRGFYGRLKSKSLVPSEKGRNWDRIGRSLQISFCGVSTSKVLEVHSSTTEKYRVQTCNKCWEITVFCWIVGKLIRVLKSCTKSCEHFEMCITWLFSYFWTTWAALPAKCQAGSVPITITASAKSVSRNECIHTKRIRIPNFAFRSF